MSAIRIVDTSVFCNILEVPSRCQDKERTLRSLETFVGQGDKLLLPMAAVYETGNHIAQESGGHERRRVAERFAKQVRKAIEGKTPFSPTQIHDTEEVGEWLSDFPEYAMRGLGIGDRSIITVWQQQCELNPSRRVVIWSYDSDLQAYDRSPQM